MRHINLLIIILSTLTWEANAKCTLYETVNETFNFGKLVIPIGVNVGSTLVTQIHPAGSSHPLVKAGMFSKCTLNIVSESSAWPGGNEIQESKIDGIGFTVKTNGIFHHNPPNKIELKAREEFYHNGTEVSLIKIGDIIPGSYTFVGNAYVDPVDNKANKAVNVLINAEFHKPSCQLENNSKNQNVHLGIVNTVDLSKNGGLSSKIPFTLKLNCPPAAPSKATVTFSGQPESADQSLLALTPTSGGAEGLAVRINNSDGTKIDLGSPSSPIPLLSGGTNELKFTAQYQVLTGHILKPGIANATASFTVEYD